MLCAVLLGIVGCNRESLVHDLSERDANRLVTELHGEGIEVTRKSQPDGRYSLEVERSGVVSALQFLESNRLIRDSREGKSVSTPFGATREDRRLHYERSISQELEATLERIPGIREARVHLNIPPADSLFERGGEVSPPTASVLVIRSPKAEVDREALSRLIGGAAGIGAPRVTVIVQTATAGVERIPELEVTRPEPKGGSSIWSTIAVLEISHRWMLAAALVGCGVLAIGCGLRTPRRAMRSTAGRSA